jgi:hypothetical protein
MHILFVLFVIYFVIKGISNITFKSDITFKIMHILFVNYFVIKGILHMYTNFKYNYAVIKSQQDKYF